MHNFYATWPCRIIFDRLIRPQDQKNASSDAKSHDFRHMVACSEAVTAAI